MYTYCLEWVADLDPFVLMELIEHRVYRGKNATLWNQYR